MKFWGNFFQRVVICFVSIFNVQGLRKIHFKTVVFTVVWSALFVSKCVLTKSNVFEISGYPNDLRIDRKCVTALRCFHMNCNI